MRVYTWPSAIDLGKMLRVLHRHIELAAPARSAWSLTERQPSHVEADV